MRVFPMAAVFFLLVKVLATASAPAVAPVHLLTEAWPAKWIEVPQTPSQDYGVYHFRKFFTLAEKPASLSVHVSGDNRYQLYLNGHLVSWGPARGDLTHWRYETVDLAPQLQAGKNVLASVVWNDGPYRAIAQITNRTGFLLQADDPQYAQLNSGPEWKCLRDEAYQPLPAPGIPGYVAIAANESVDAGRYPWNWQQVEFNDASWLNAQVITPGAPRDAKDAPNRWMLVPRSTPLEELKTERIPVLRSSRNLQAPAGFPQQTVLLIVPAHTETKILLDQTYLTTGYPELTVSGGKNAVVRLRYAETLYTSRKPINKGNRSDVDGKLFLGFADSFRTDGGPKRFYRPLFWRTWRYLQLEIKTENQPLTINDIHGLYSAYPFMRQATLEVDDPIANADIQNLLNTGWRTARLCAHETYMDCPYYEQLQYAGDARIQMLVSLYMTGDARLMKNGIEQLNSSRTAEGATLSRAPSALQQYIPPFSLWWIGMVHDYWMYVNDPQFIKQMLPGVRAVLSFYRQYQMRNGSLQKMPWWNFVDWVKQWKDGVPPAESDGSSAAALDLQLLLAYRWASELEWALDSHAVAAEYSADASQLKAAILQNDWDASQGLFADQPSHQTYSQNVNTLAVLAGVVDREQARALMTKTFENPDLAPASIYFRAYLNSTLRLSGLGDQYLSKLGPWREMLRDGLTTWAEWNGPDSRSDCHAWGASPNFELFRTLVGVEPMEPGYVRVRIAPHLGNLHRIKAVIPHPEGKIEVEFDKYETGLPGRKTSSISAVITLPSGTTGLFEWNGKSFPLQSGKTIYPEVN